MFLDLWNFWCLIWASKVLLAFTVLCLHFPTRAATLAVSLLPTCLANNILFSVKGTSGSAEQVLGPAPAQMYCRAVQLRLLHLFVFQLCATHPQRGLLPQEGERVLPISVWPVVEQSLGRSGSGYMHAAGDIRAMFHALASAITFSVLVSSPEERDLREVISRTHKKGSQLRVKMQVGKRQLCGN